MQSEERRLSGATAVSQPSGARAASAPPLTKLRRRIYRIFHRRPCEKIPVTGQRSSVDNETTPPATSAVPDFSGQSSAVVIPETIPERPSNGDDDGSAVQRSQVLEASQSQPSIDAMPPVPTLANRLLQQLVATQDNPEPNVPFRFPPGTPVDVTSLPPYSVDTADNALSEGQTAPPAPTNIANDTPPANIEADLANPSRHARNDSSWTVRSYRSAKNLLARVIPISLRQGSRSSSFETLPEPEDASPSNDATATVDPILGREMTPSVIPSARQGPLRFAVQPRPELTTQDRVDLYEDRLASRLYACPRTSQQAKDRLDMNNLELAIAIENEMEAEKERTYRKVKEIRGPQSKPQTTVEAMVLSEKQRQRAANKALKRVNTRISDVDRLGKYPRLWPRVMGALGRPDPKIPERLVRPPPRYTEMQQARRRFGGPRPIVNGIPIEGRRPSSPLPVASETTAIVDPTPSAPTPAPVAVSIQDSEDFTTRSRVVYVTNDVNQDEIAVYSGSENSTPDEEDM